MPDLWGAWMTLARAMADPHAPGVPAHIVVQGPWDHRADITTTPLEHVMTVHIRGLSRWWRGSRLILGWAIDAPSLASLWHIPPSAPFCPGIVLYDGEDVAYAIRLWRALARPSHRIQGSFVASALSAWSPDGESDAPPYPAWTPFALTPAERIVATRQLVRQGMWGSRSVRSL